MESNGRRNDFVKTLKSIADKTLPINNIALNLLLDIGRFLDCNTVHNMRYNKTTLDFWTIFHKLFRGKGIRFMRGLKASGLDGNPKEEGPIKPEACHLNFVVPASRILIREGEQFRLDASKPGVLSGVLQDFAKVQKKPDVKLCFDGKKIASGFGKVII